MGRVWERVCSLWKRAEEGEEAEGEEGASPLWCLPCDLLGVCKATALSRLCWKKAELPESFQEDPPPFLLPVPGMASQQGGPGT